MLVNIKSLSCISMNSTYGIISLLLVVAPTITYIFDVINERAKPARSTKILMFLLMWATLFVQGNIYVSWVLAFTVGLVISQTLLLIFTLKYGVGGVNKLDIICYIFFAGSLLFYLLTKNPFISLLLLITTDFIAFLPTIVKNWKDPRSDTWLFFIVEGVIAPIFSILASDTNSISEIIFPSYLIVVNLIAVWPVIFYQSILNKQHSI